MKSEKIYIEYLVLKVQADVKLPSEGQVGDELFKVIHPKTKAFVLKILGHGAAVDDCVQNTLLQVFKKLGHLKQVKAFHTWLFRIAYSSCMDYIRKNPVHVDADIELSSDPIEFDQQLDVKTAIAHLAETQQVVIFLFYFEGFKVAEIAAILKQPAGTIKHQLFVARDLLKKQLSQPNQPESNHEY